MDHSLGHGVAGKGSQLLGGLEATEQGGPRVVAVQHVVVDVAHLGGVPALVPVRRSLALDHVRAQLTEAVVRVLQPRAPLPVAAVPAVADLRPEVAQAVSQPAVHVVRRQDTVAHGAFDFAQDVADLGTGARERWLRQQQHNPLRTDHIEAGQLLQHRIVVAQASSFRRFRHRCIVRSCSLYLSAWCGLGLVARRACAVALVSAAMPIRVRLQAVALEVPGEPDRLARLQVAE